MSPRIIRLREHQTRALPSGDLDGEVARLLWRHYRTQVAIAPPSLLNDQQWELTAQGWVGHIPLTPDLRLVLEPKVPLVNLFRMLEFAYRLAQFGPGVVAVDTLEEVYQHLAVVLAKRVLDRARQGLYRAYIPRQERTSYVRGRLDLGRLARSPWQPHIDCRFQEHTADNDDNRILAWTLFGILRSGICDEEGQRVLRQAFQQVAHYTTLEPIDAAACVNRPYHRLSEDYRPLHALCHLFLDGSGPTHRSGEHTMVPFLVDMARLFQDFVAEWLTERLTPQGLRLKAQHRVDLDAHGGLHFDIDLVLWSGASGLPLCVLDTKYKTGEAGADIHQIVAYAHSVGCRHAFLIYPTPLPAPIAGRAGDIVFHSLTFDLASDLEAAGERLVEELAHRCRGVRAAMPG